MGHAERRAVSAAAIATPHARETTLATRSWRSRVAAAALLRELRLLDARRLVPTVGDRSPRLLDRFRRLIWRLAAPRPVRPRTVPELVITADWRMPGEARPEVGSRRIGEEPGRGASRGGRRSDAGARDAEAVLSALGELGPEALESALRVVRRMRSLAGAA